ncbi:MAG: hypothetical protein ACI4E1_03725 [Lachnospira sp.]
MYELKVLKRLYYISAICLVIFASTFLFMPITNIVPVQYTRLSSVIIGAVFWITGLVGYGLLAFLYIGKKKKERNFYFFSNKITAISDVMFLVGIVSFVSILLLELTTTYLGYVAIFITILSFNMHWIFSRNYLRILERQVRRSDR